MNWLIPGWLVILLAGPVGATPLLEAIILGTGQTLAPDEVLETATRLDLLFKDGTIARLERGSALGFSGERALFLTRGTLWLRVPPQVGGLSLRINGVQIEGGGGSLVAVVRKDGSFQVIGLYHDPRGRFTVGRSGQPPQALGIGQVLTLGPGKRRRPPQVADLVALLDSELFTGLLTPSTPPLTPEFQEALAPALSEIHQALAHQSELLHLGRLRRR